MHGWERELDMREHLEGKVVLVTGAGSGIGEASANAFSKYGCKVCVADLRGDAAIAVASAIVASGGTAMAITVDVANEASQKELFSAILERFGQLDIAHLNAGVLPRGGVLDTHLSDWQQALDVNVTGVLLGIRGCAEAMGGRGGAIVVTASVAGLLGSAGMAAYVVSKHAVVGLVKAAAADLNSEGIRVNAVCPGATYTGMLLASGSLEEVNRSPVAELNIQKRVAEPSEIAEVVCFLSGEAASYVTGGIYPVDGGSTATGRRSV